MLKKVLLINLKLHQKKLKKYLFFFLYIMYIQIKNNGMSNDIKVTLKLVPNPIAIDIKTKYLNLEFSILFK